MGAVRVLGWSWATTVQYVPFSCVRSGVYVVVMCIYTSAGIVCTGDRHGSVPDWREKREQRRIFVSGVVSFEKTRRQRENEHKCTCIATFIEQATERRSGTADTTPLFFFTYVLLGVVINTWYELATPVCPVLNIACGIYTYE